MQKILLLMVTLVFFNINSNAQCGTIWVDSGTNTGCVGSFVSLHYSYSLTQSPWLVKWSVNGVYVSTSTSFSSTIDNISQTITANQVTGLACSSSIILTPITTPPALTTTNNVNACIGSALQLSSGNLTYSNSTYKWTGPNSFTSTLANPIISTNATNAMSGSYSVVEVTAPVRCSTCTSTRYATCQSPPSLVSVVISQPSTPTATNNSPICLGNMLSLSASSIQGATYRWTGPNGFVSNQQNPAISASAASTMAGTYTVTASLNGCSSPSSATVVAINSNVTPTFTQVASICSGASLTSLPATSNNGIIGTWLPAVNNTITTTYTFTPNVGQCANTASQTITIKTPKTTSAILFVH